MWSQESNLKWCALHGYKCFIVCFYSKNKCLSALVANFSGDWNRADACCLHSRVLSWKKNNRNFCSREIPMYFCVQPCKRILTLFVYEVWFRPQHQPPPASPASEACSHGTADTRLSVENTCPCCVRELSQRSALLHLLDVFENLGIKTSAVKWECLCRILSAVLFLLISVDERPQGS